ncbi:unnamed protein product [Taenia asiatica]|uniref:LAM_G_DOMAIN domain-containing protein n=1 Tax=Taenia asiatica TaxID=60517 RepID=A0A158R9Y2_TAEAS|nr:unnamed protein product [Taenia asiatica]
MCDINFAFLSSHLAFANPSGRLAKPLLQFQQVELFISSSDPSIGCNESYYELSLKSGLLHLRFRLPAEVPSDQPTEAVSPTALATLTAFKWFQSARAGHLSVRETLHAFAGLESRLDDGQFHDLLLERSPDQIRVSVDENTIFFQPLSFDKIRPGFLEIQHIVLGSLPKKSTDPEAFGGQIRRAILQVDDTTLNILQFAENSLHGFEITGGHPTKCATESILFSSVSLRRVYLLLRLPSPSTKSSPPPLFNKLPMYTDRIHDWQQIEVDFNSHSKNAFLFLLFHRLGELSDPLLSVELRDGSPWLVTQKQSLEIRAIKTNLLRVGAGKITIPGRHEAAIIAVGYATLEYFVAIDGDEFRPAFEAEVAGVLESAIEGHDSKTLFGRNLLLGGTNWTAEEEFGRGLHHLWSGLGRRKQFTGCIHRAGTNTHELTVPVIETGALLRRCLTITSLASLGASTRLRVSSGLETKFRTMAKLVFRIGILDPPHSLTPLKIDGLLKPLNFSSYYQKAMQITGKEAQYLKLNGEVVNFEPLIRSRLRHRPLKRDQRLQVGCHSPPANCLCHNGGVCVDGECNCLATAFSGELCHIPAKILDFDKMHQLRLRFPLPHRLESTEVQFAFKTRTRNTTLLSSYSQGFFSPMMQFFDIIQPDGMRIDLVDGCLVVVVMLEGRENVSLELLDNFAPPSPEKPIFKLFPSSMNRSIARTLIVKKIQKAFVWSNVVSKSVLLKLYVDGVLGNGDDTSVRAQVA